eukprot:350388-Chlamydomonas_euryale.AAC.14
MRHGGMQQTWPDSNADVVCIAAGCPAVVPATTSKLFRAGCNVCRSAPSNLQPQEAVPRHGAS